MRVDGLEGDLVSHGTGDEEIFVVADRVRLRQVLVNLLSNAVKYNRPQGEVRVQWQVSADRCELRITDDGYGMAPEKLERSCSSRSIASARRTRRSRAPASAWSCRAGWSS